MKSMSCLWARDSSDWCLRQVVFQEISYLSSWRRSLLKPVGQERIGKDDVRQLSLGVFQRRIAELKHDSEQQDQDTLLKGIHAITKFCLDKKENVFLVPDQALQEQNGLRDLLNRLLDYRIIHSVGTALTHKSNPGTYTAYMLDIGAYAKFRKLEGRFESRRHRR